MRIQPLVGVQREGILPVRQRLGCGQGPDDPVLGQQPHEGNLNLQHSKVRSQTRPGPNSEGHVAARNDLVQIFLRKALWIEAQGIREVL